MGIITTVFGIFYNIWNTSWYIFTSVKPWFFNLNTITKIIQDLYVNMTLTFLTLVTRGTSWQLVTVTVTVTYFPYKIIIKQVSKVCIQWTYYMQYICCPFTLLVQHILFIRSNCITPIITCHTTVFHHIYLMMKINTQYEVTFGNTKIYTRSTLVFLKDLNHYL